MTRRKSPPFCAPCRLRIRTSARASGAARSSSASRRNWSSHSALVLSRTEKAWASSGRRCSRTSRVQEFIQAAVIGISLGAQYALLALGFTLIFGILGVVNFAHGGFYMLGGYVAYSCVAGLGLPYPLGVLIAVL